MNLTILGPTGFLGIALVHKAVQDGHRVSVLARNPEKLGDFGSRIRCVTGDAVDPDAVLEAITGSEAVISTIAPSKTKPADPAVQESILRNILEAMEKAGTRRLIHIGGAGYAVRDDESWIGARRFLRRMLLLCSRTIMEAKRLEWLLIKDSNLDWTLVRPPAILAGKAKGALRASETELGAIRVERDALVDFLLSQLNDREWIRKAPLVWTSK